LNRYVASDPATASGAVPAAGTDRPDAFVSYAREDEQWVHGKLCPALVANGKDVWIDAEDIRGGASDWWPVVRDGIESAKAMVFVLTPDSLASEVCGSELRRAVELNKRIIAVRHRGVDGLAIPDALARTNWISSSGADDFAASVATLITALETDEEWVAAHARLTQRTVEWLREDRDASYLLRGSDLRAAERWLDERGSHRESPTSDQVAYIHAGHRASARRQRLVLAGVASALGVSVILGVIALIQRDNAIEREQEARSRELAARSLEATPSDPELGVRLALDAAGVRDTVEAAQALRQAVVAATWVAILRVDRRPLRDAAFSPSGDRVATAGANGKAVVWDIRTRRRVALLDHREPINTVGFSPDGRRLVTAGSDGTARTWDAARGSSLLVLRPGSGEVVSAAFGAGGRRIITSTDDGGAQVWDAHGGREVARLGGRGDRLATTGLSPDGHHALTAFDSDARLWTISPPRVVAVLRGSGGVLTTAVFSPDGRRILTGDADGHATVWAARDGRLVARLRGHSEGITDARFSRSSARVVLASNDGRASLWNAGSGRRIALLPHGRPVNAARFSPDGRRVVTASDDGTARVWRAAGGRAEQVLRGHTDRVIGADFSPDGTRILTASDDGSARVWTTRRPGVTLLDGAWEPEADANFNPTSRLVLAVSGRGRAAVWDGVSGRRIAMLAGGVAPATSVESSCGRLVGCAPWSPDGRLVAAAGAGGTAVIWDARTGAILRRLGRAGGSVTGVAFSPDGTRAVLTDDEPTAQIWDLAPERLVARAPRPPPAADDGVHSAAFAPDGRHVLTVSWAGRAAISDLGNGRSVLPSGLTQPGAAAISPDGTQVALGTVDGELRVSDVRTGRLLHVAAAHVGLVNAVAYDRAGDRIVTAGDDRTARVWDARALAPLKLLGGHVGQVMSAAFSPDDRFVLTTSVDGTARLWDPALQGSVQTWPKSAAGSAQFSHDSARLAIVGRERIEVHRCDVCGTFDALVRLARAAIDEPRRRP
jgi:WD40 repeat protein